MGVLLSLHPNCADSRSESRGGLRGAASSPSVGIAIGKVDEWLVQAKPGDRLEYHRGYLAMDRGVGSRLGEESGLELDRVATAVMAMAAAGHVHLVQRRHGPNDYTYVAVRARSPRRSARPGMGGRS